jgi:polyphosphate kinase
MQSDGTYLQRKPARGDEAKSSQQLLIEGAVKRNRQASRLKKRKLKSFVAGTD